MKKTAILIALAMAATASLGAINIAWENGGFLSGRDASLYAPEDSTQILWELVYTASSSVGTPTLDTKTGAISYGSDEVLSSRLWKAGSTDMVVEDKVAATTESESPLTFNLDYGIIESGLVRYLNANYEKDAGGIYAAVFQYCDDGSVYYEVTDLNTSINWKNTMSGSDKVNFDVNDDVQIKNLLGTIDQPTQVPEPATMSLLGLGALAMVLRRKLRK